MVAAPVLILSLLRILVNSRVLVIVRSIIDKVEKNKKITAPKNRYILLEAITGPIKI